jgi:hypothetical protein
MEKRKVNGQKGGLQGEGNYDAAREYNERTKRFVKSGRVEKATRDAEPKTDKQAAELRRAEEVGKNRAKEDEPADGMRVRAKDQLR